MTSRTDRERCIRGHEVASAKEVADSISGSLVDAANLSERLGNALAILAARGVPPRGPPHPSPPSASACASWDPEGARLDAVARVRQVLGESLAQGVLGGLLGVVLGIVVASSIGAFGPTLTA